MAPEIILRGDVDAEISYVRPHLEYILQELFKNAMRATVETHGKAGGSAVDEDVCVGLGLIGTRRTALAAAAGVGRDLGACGVWGATVRGGGG